MQLTTHFTAEEFFGPNSGGYTDFDAAKAWLLATLILEPIRGRWGRVRINSGKRSVAHNASVGGVPTSDHLYLGECAAADIYMLDGGSAGMPDALKLLATPDYGRAFGQAILYFDARGTPRFLHVSLPSRAHVRQLLTATYEAPRKYSPFTGGEPHRP